MSCVNTHYGARLISEMLKDKKKIYFIGIGGINMSSLAHLTLRNGYEVGGSDRTETALTRYLDSEGIEVFYSHDARNIESYDACVYTVAISGDNPEYLRAAELGIPRISRADYLGYIMTSFGNRIGISGMHGKSTCTSMCAKVFMSSRRDPTVLSGAELDDMGGAYRLGSGDDFIFEACEYMDSFLSFYPSVAVILNIENDHVDYFKSLDHIKRSFASFASIAGKDGVTVVNADDGNIADALKGFDGRVISFGVDSKDADYTARGLTNKKGCYSFELWGREGHIIDISLSVTGRYNVYNALAAAVTALISGISPEDIAVGLSAFRGAKRRMEYRGSVGGAAVYEDYGHHPTEIAATLEGAKALAEGRLFCVYQPHTYSRTAALFDDFARCFDSADRVAFVDIYAAREVNSFGVSSHGLARAVGEKALYCQSFSDAAEYLASELREGDAAVIMGAGDIYKVFDHLMLDEGKEDKR